MRPIYDFHNVLHMDVVLFRVQGYSKAVVLAPVHSLMAHCLHLTMHVQHLEDNRWVINTESLTRDLL